MTRYTKTLRDFINEKLNEQSETESYPINEMKNNVLGTLSRSIKGFVLKEVKEIISLSVTGKAENDFIELVYIMSDDSVITIKGNYEEEVGVITVERRDALTSDADSEFSVDGEYFKKMFMKSGNDFLAALIRELFYTDSSVENKKKIVIIDPNRIKRSR